MSEFNNLRRKEAYQNRFERYLKELNSENKWKLLDEFFQKNLDQIDVLNEQKMNESINNLLQDIYSN